MRVHVPYLFRVIDVHLTENMNILSNDKINDSFEDAAARRSEMLVAPFTVSFGNLLSN